MSGKLFSMGLLAITLCFSSACVGEMGEAPCLSDDDCDDDIDIDDSDADVNDDTNCRTDCEEGTYRCNPDRNMGPNGDPYRYDLGTTDYVGHIQVCELQDNGCNDWEHHEFCDGPSLNIWCSEMGGTPHCTPRGCPDWVENSCGGFSNLGIGRCHSITVDGYDLYELQRCFPHPDSDSNPELEGCAVWETVVDICRVGTCTNRNGGDCEWLPH